MVDVSFFKVAHNVAREKCSPDESGRTPFFWRASATHSQQRDNVKNIVYVYSFLNKRTQ